MYHPLCSGPDDIPSMVALVPSHGQTRREDHSKVHHDAEQDEGAGPQGEVVEVIAGQRTGHGRRLQVELHLCQQHSRVVWNSSTYIKTLAAPIGFPSGIPSMPIFKYVNKCWATEILSIGLRRSMCLVCHCRFFGTGLNYYCREKTFAFPSVLRPSSTLPHPLHVVTPHMGPLGPSPGGGMPPPPLTGDGILGGNTPTPGGMMPTPPFMRVTSGEIYELF